MRAFAAVFVLSVVVNVVEEEMGTILPILYECLICIKVFILEVIHVICTKAVASTQIERILLSFSCVTHFT